MESEVKMLFCLLAIAMFLALCAAVRDYWVRRGRQEWNEFMDELINHD